MLQAPPNLVHRVACKLAGRSGEIRTKMFRHTDCAGRLQMRDGGLPVSPYTVVGESSATLEKAKA
jgi:hypothetical protein